MRRFGLALVRDDRFVCDDGSAASLVDKLFRQASLTLIDDPSRRRSIRAGARLRPVHPALPPPRPPSGGRRRRRRLGRGLGVDGRANASVTSGVRNLPPELREALLLVVLAGFSHCEAAEALDIPLAAVIDRLGRARARISAHIGAARESTRSGNGLAARRASADRQVTSRFETGGSFRLCRQLPRSRRSAGVRGAAARGCRTEASGRAVGVAKRGDPRRLRRRRPRRAPRSTSEGIRTRIFRSGWRRRSNRAEAPSRRARPAKRAQSRRARRRDRPADAVPRPRPRRGSLSAGACLAIAALAAGLARRRRAGRPDVAAGQLIDAGLAAYRAFAAASDVPVEFRTSDPETLTKWLRPQYRPGDRRPRVFFERADAAGRTHRAGNDDERRVSRL